MRPLLFTLLLGIMFTACKEAPELERTKEELSKKKAELIKLTEEVTALEAKMVKLEPKAAKAAVAAKPKLVVVEAINPSTLQHYIELQGGIEADQNLTITPKQMGQITAVLVKEGDRVRKGQLLATVDDDILVKSIEEVKTGLETSSVIYTRQKNLWDQKIGTEIQYIQAKNQKESLEQRLNTLNAQLALCKIYSPIDGIVDNVGLKAGEVPGPFNNSIRVVNLNKVKVKAKVADSYIGSVKEGANVKLNFAEIGKTIDAKISFMSKVVDPMSRTFTIQVDLNNGDGMLRPNMLASIKLNDVNKSGILVINQNLVQATEKGNFVFVAVEKEGKNVAEQRAVVLGLTYNGRAEVVSGLNPGDKLITVGAQEVEDGSLLQY